MCTTPTTKRGTCSKALTPRLDALIVELQSNRDKAAQSGIYAKYESTLLE